MLDLHKNKHLAKKLKWSIENASEKALTIFGAYPIRSSITTLILIKIQKSVMSTIDHYLKNETAQKTKIKIRAHQ